MYKDSQARRKSGSRLFDHVMKMRDRYENSEKFDENITFLPKPHKIDNFKDMLVFHLIFHPITGHKYVGHSMQHPVRLTQHLKECNFEKFLDGVEGNEKLDKRKRVLCAMTSHPEGFGSLP